MEERGGNNIRVFLASAVHEAKSKRERFLGILTVTFCLMCTDSLYPTMMYHLPQLHSMFTALFTVFVLLLYLLRPAFPAHSEKVGGRQTRKTSFKTEQVHFRLKNRETGVQ